MKTIKFLLILILFVSLGACNSNDIDHKEFTVEDFSKKRYDTLIPYENGSYVMFYVKIKGSVNDTVKFKIDGFWDIRLQGKIDTIFQSDYYGGNKIPIMFEPYKASKGKLEVVYSL